MTVRWYGGAHLPVSDAYPGRPIRVAYVIGSGHVGGAEKQLTRLACELQRGGGLACFVVFTGEAGPLSVGLEPHQVPWVSGSHGGLSPSRLRWIPTKDSLTGMASLIVLANHLRRFRPDVVHAMLPHAIADGFMLARMAAPGAVRIAGLRGRTAEDSTRRWPELRRFKVEARLSRALTHADAVLVNAPHLIESEAVRLGADAAKVHLIPNGVDIPDWQADPVGDPPVGVVVANFHPYKGYDTLIDALALMEVPLTVKFCGTGPQRGVIQRLVSDRGVADRVCFVDPPADVPRELRSAQIGIHPSRTEGLSNAILEQMAAGLPLIVTDVGGARLQVTEDHNGLLVPPDDPYALAKALTKLASSPSLRAHMGRASRQHAETFAWGACTQAHLHLYERLLKQRRSGS